MTGMRAFVILAALPLAACQTAAPPKTDPQVYFAARGNEGLSLTPDEFCEAAYHAKKFTGVFEKITEGSF